MAGVLYTFTSSCGICMTDVEAERYRCAELVRWFRDRAKCWKEPQAVSQMEQLLVAVEQGHWPVGLEVLPEKEAILKMGKD